MIRRLKDFPPLLFVFLRGVIVGSGSDDSFTQSRVGGPGRRASRGGAGPAVTVTPEMQELYIELMCQFQPDAVLPYLQSNSGSHMCGGGVLLMLVCVCCGVERVMSDRLSSSHAFLTLQTPVFHFASRLRRACAADYGLDVCLSVCEAYKITDATAFLLERTGDVAAALLLITESIDAHMATLNATFTAPDYQPPLFDDDDDVAAAVRVPCPVPRVSCAVCVGALAVPVMTSTTIAN